MTTFLLWYHRVMSAYYLKKAHKTPVEDQGAWEFNMTMSASHAAELMKILAKEIKA